MVELELQWEIIIELSQDVFVKSIGFFIIKLMTNVIIRLQLTGDLSRL